MFGNLIVPETAEIIILAVILVCAAVYLAVSAAKKRK